MLLVLSSCVVSTTRDDNGSVTYKVEILDFDDQTDDVKPDKVISKETGNTKTALVLKAVVTRLVSK